MAFLSLLVVSQSLFHGQESSRGEVYMKENSLKENVFKFLVHLHRAFLSICGVCDVSEWSGILDWKQNNHEICTNLLVKLPHREK